MEIKRGNVSIFIMMQFIGAATSILSSILFLYQFLEQLNHPINKQSISNTFLMILFVVGFLAFIVGYFKEKENKTHRRISFRRKLKKVDIEEKQQKNIVKPISENDVASWKVDGMKQYYERAKYGLNTYVRDMEVDLKDLTQQERELYVIHDLIMRLMKEMIEDKITLSCVDIYLIFAKLEVYHVHHEKRLYESYKVNLTPPQQVHLDLLLDPRTREIIRFLLKDRYAFLPEDMANHLTDAVKQMEKAADGGNIFAQYDLANVYLSSEFYGGMEAAVFYLHRADNAQHAGAGELLHELQTA